MTDALLGAFLPYVPLVLLVSIRVGVAFASMPAPFGDLAPMQIRAAAGVLVALALVLPHPEAAHGIHVSAAWLARAGLGEAVLGAVMGFTVRVTLAAAEIAGSIAGFSMGMGFATSVDPTFGEAVPPTTRAIGSFAIVVFFALQGHHVLLTAMAATLELAPPGRAFDAVSHEGILRVGSSMMAHGLRIAAPVVATMFVVQIGTALVSRAAPRVQMFALTFAIAVTAGMLTLLVAAPSMAPAIAAEVQGMNEALRVALVGP